MNNENAELGFGAVAECLADVGIECSECVYFEVCRGDVE